MNIYFETNENDVLIGVHVMNYESEMGDEGILIQIGFCFFSLIIQIS